MQISASNLLVAGQQPKPAQQAAAPQANKTDGFEALLFKPGAAPAGASAAPAASGPAQPYAALKAPGSTIDIRV